MCQFRIVDNDFDCCPTFKLIKKLLKSKAIDSRTLDPPAA
jgi:hypothetical protein